MKYKGGVFITIIFFFSIVLSLCSLAHSSSTKSFFWLEEREDMKAMTKENEIGVGVGSANEVEERQVPTGSDPLHHKHVPFTSP
ncbi:CLAVATA3/ESR (CLE)-related protein 40-like [Raphanus sativus]|uniref:CLAVATA3/ESR (CLE)-related protein 40-like n=1 Tax=Raphanus sativus TaxID=3726 RepID=A0A6J0MUN4_RAPSA|nr:CLAVATA3/ESR (CLE)-related protein 40-like [Raphanus sativus]